MLSIGVGFQLLNMNNTNNLNPSRQFIETFKTNGQNSHIFPFPSSLKLSRFPSSTELRQVVPTTVDAMLSAKKGERYENATATLQCYTQLAALC